MTEPWLSMHSFIMISGMNGSGVAELLCHSIIVTSDLFYDGTMDDYVHCHHDIWYEWV